jgi:DNA (cytosine-5)-methyltransferase 1
MRALDLFCSAGGATMGLANHFTVCGVDIVDQPNYPYRSRFTCTDALSLDPAWIAAFDLVWASPPCQGRTAYRRRPNHVAPVDTDGAIAQTRELLKRAGVPYIIENVPGAPLESPTMLCGSMFGLDVRRHRMFETSFPVVQLACDHASQLPRYAPASNRTNLRRTVEVGVYRIPLDVQRRAMGIDWMTLAELSQAIPPAYATFLAGQFLEARSVGNEWRE